MQDAQTIEAAVDDAFGDLETALSNAEEIFAQGGENPAETLARVTCAMHHCTNTVAIYNQLASRSMRRSWESKLNSLRIRAHRIIEGAKKEVNAELQPQLVTVA